MQATKTELRTLVLAKAENSRLLSKLQQVSVGEKLYCDFQLHPLRYRHLDYTSGEQFWPLFY